MYFRGIPNDLYGQILPETFQQSGKIGQKPRSGFPEAVFLSLCLSDLCFSSSELDPKPAGVVTSWKNEGGCLEVANLIQFLRRSSGHASRPEHPKIGNDWYDSTALNGSPVVLISILIRFQLNVPEIPSLRAKIIDSSDQTFCVSLSSEHQEPSSNHDLTYGFYILDDIPNSSESNHGSASASLCLIIRYSVYFDGKYWIRKKQIG